MTLAELRQSLSTGLEKFRAEAGRDEREGLERLLLEHHTRATTLLKGVRHAERIEPVLASVKSLLGEADEDAVELARIGAIVHPDGSIVGVGKYENLDPEWSLALVKYLEYRERKAPFAADPQLIELDDRLSLSLVGDWGTGYFRGDATPAARVAVQVAARSADYTIHLGDVYYAGTEEEETRYLIDVWPRGRRDQFALNSNHEMYCGGQFYFGKALPEAFASQKGTSYFALRNRGWLIIGLDTAYEASELYLKGSLGDDTPQTRWLAALADRVGDRKVMVLSHHEPYEIAGDRSTRVYEQVRRLLRRVPDYWYWGHLHNAIVYRPTGDGLSGRCVGHGAIPYGNATLLQGAPNVVWYETEKAGDPDCPERVLCGFAQLELEGPVLKERLIGEDGSVRWQP